MAIQTKKVTLYSGVATALFLTTAVLLMLLQSGEGDEKKKKKIQNASYAFGGLTVVGAIVYILLMRQGHGLSGLPRTNSLAPTYGSNRTMYDGPMTNSFPMLRRDSNLSATIPWSSSQTTLE